MSAAGLGCVKPFCESFWRKLDTTGRVPAHERFAKPLVPITERSNEGLPISMPRLLCELDPSVLEINEAGLVIVRKVRWHRATPVTPFSDIV